jgi:trimeric autotransporter adhesin
LSGVEKVSVLNFQTLAMNVAAATIDASLFDSSLATVALGASSTTATMGDTAFTNVQKIVNAEMSQGLGSLNVGIIGTATAGSADAMSLTLANQTGGTFTAAGIETLNVVSNTSENTVTLATGFTTVNVSGAVKANLGALAATVTTLDASNSTGGVAATVGVATITVTGGTGNDTITTGTNLGTGSVKAGAGIDTLVVTNSAVIAVAADGAKYTGFETFSRLAVEGATGTTRTQDMALLSGITTVNASLQDNVITGNEATTSGVTFTNLAATTNTLNITALSTIESVVAANGVELTANVVASRASNTLADALTINLGSATAASGATSIAGTAVLGDILLNVTASNEESLTINSLFGANFITTLNAAALTSLTATGSKALTIGTISNNTLTTKINASAMTDSFIMGVNGGTTASTISGGTGADTLIGGTAADVITGGAGNDAITAGAGADNISGGDGDDTITVSTITDFTLALETVSGGAGNDTLSFTQAAATTLTAANLAGISGIEQISIANGNTAISVTLTDAVFTANGQALKIIDGDLTQGALTVDGSALTAANVLDVTANTTTLFDDSLVGGAGNDIFRFSTLAGLEAADTVTGGAGIDTIILAAATSVGTAVLTNVRTIEKITTTGTGNAINITVGASTMAASTTLTTDASAQSTSTGLLTYLGGNVALDTVVQNVTGTGANDAITGGAGNDIILGGSGDDGITGGLGIDNLSGGDGVDTFSVVASGAGFVGLTAAETVSGGSGNDILTFATGALVVASTDLLGLSSIETITAQNVTNTTSITLTDAVYTANGLTALTVDNVTATSGVLTLAAGSLSAANSVKVIVSKADNSGALSLVLGSGNDTVVIDGDAVNNGSTMTAGTGTDTLEIVRQTTAATAVIAAGVTGFETVLFSTAAGTYAFSTLDASVASGITQTVNASALTGTLLWDGSLEADGLYSITTGSGADSLTGGQKNDTISAGQGNDVITGGLGADSLTGGAGADTFVYAMGTGFLTTESNGTLTDTITDFTSGLDKLRVTLNYGTLTSALDINATVGTARAGTSLIQDNLSGARGQAVYDTTGSALYINANADNLLTTSDFKININPASTATATLGDGDINFVITGGTNDDVIVSGAGADTIDGGAGVDNITGGGGLDVLTGSAGSDVFVSTAVLATNAVNITDFTTAADDFDFNGTLLNAAVSTVVVATAAATLTAALTADTSTVFVVNLGANNGALTTAVAAYLANKTAANADAVEAAAVTAIGADADLDADITVLESILIAVDNNHTDNVGESMIFRFANTTAAGNVIDAGELTLIGILGSGNLVAGDFI